MKIQGITILASLVTVLAAGTNDATAAQREETACEGWHSYLMNPNTYCFDEDEEEGWMGCNYISQQLCNGIEVAAVNACWIVPAGVAQTCCWGTECN